MSGEHWWIEAQGRAWGPYAAERLPAFRDEGRLGPASRIGRAPEGPFVPAAEALPTLFAAATAATTGVPEPREAPAQPGSRALLVISDVAEDGLAALEAALAARGQAVRVRHGLWLLRVPEGAAATRNALSRALGAAAMLIVVEAPVHAAAWFNLEGDTDRALRRLWTGG